MLQTGQDQPSLNSNEHTPHTIYEPMGGERISTRILPTTEIIQLRGERISNKILTEACRKNK